jgi:hypothetical protein
MNDLMVYPPRQWLHGAWEGGEFLLIPFMKPGRLALPILAIELWVVICRQSVHYTDGEHRFHVGSARGYLRHQLDSSRSSWGDWGQLTVYTQTVGSRDLYSIICNLESRTLVVYSS